MDSDSLINVIDGYNYITMTLCNTKAGMYTLAGLSLSNGSFTNNPITKIFFSNSIKKKKLATKFMFKWKKTKKISEITIYSDDIKFGHYDFNIHDIPMKKYLNLGLCEEQAKIISKEYVVCNITHIFTESKFFVVNNVLLHRSYDWILSHTKYLERLSTTVARIENSLIGHHLV